MWNVKLEPRDLNVYEFLDRALGSSRVRSHASSPVPKLMLMYPASLSVGCATRCLMNALPHGHACVSNVALIHLCWCGLFQVCAVWFADQQTKVKLSPSSTILFAASICRLRGEATSVHLRLICSSDESRKLAAASWSYSCFSKGRGRSESDTAILSLTVPPSSGAFWSGLGSRWSRAQILPGACWARDNLS